MRFIVAERTRQQKLKAAVCIKPTVEKQKEVDGASTCTGSTHPGIVHTVKMDVSTSVKIISIKITPRCAQRPIPQVTLDSVKFPWTPTTTLFLLTVFVIFVTFSCSVLRQGLSHWVALAGLELTVQSRLVFNFVLILLPLPPKY